MHAASSKVTFVLGGVRSGKSRHAEKLVAGSGLVPVYLATAEAGDAEMVARIAEHRRRRGVAWLTVEEPLELPAALAAHSRAEHAVLVDCLTLWLSNLMAAGRDVERASDDLLASLEATRGPVVLVSNEVGQGIVPSNALARAFIDHSGRLHQSVATLAGSVVLMTAGIAHVVK